MDRPAVLLLERSATIIDVARECAAVEDIELHVANSVDLAIRIATRRNIVVAVLDATMAGSAPSETVGKLRALHPSLRVVFIADQGVTIDRRYAQLGFVLKKPFTSERFSDTVRSAIRLQSMSAGVQKMRHSSGTYPAVQVTETPPTGITGLPAAPRASSRPPPIPTSPPEPDAPAQRDSGVITKTSRGREQQPPIPREEPLSEPPPSLTPRPFVRVR